MNAHDHMKKLVQGQLNRKKDKLRIVLVPLDRHRFAVCNFDDIENDVFGIVYKYCERYAKKASRVIFSDVSTWANRHSLYFFESSGNRKIAAYPICGSLDEVMDRLRSVAITQGWAEPDLCPLF